MFRKSSRAGSIPGDTPTISATCLALALLLLAALAAPTASEAAVRDEIIVHRAPGLTAAERSDLRSDAGVTLKRLLPSLDRVEVVRAPVGERDEALAALRQDPDVLWAEPDHVASIATATPPDPDWGSLWGLHNAGDLGTLDADVDADEAWARSRGAGVTVAVADTGVDAHADLSGQLVAGRNFRPDDVTSTTDPTPLGPNNTRDVYSHGTHVAGTIAAVSNSRDVVGVAPEAKVMPLRVLGDNGLGSMSDVASSFAYAGDQGIRIVNASLGSTSATLAEEQAIRDHPNTLYVVAAGNDGRTLSPNVYNFFPCAYAQPNVICVGATTNLDEPANYSNRSPVSVDLFAPGTSVLSLVPGGGLANKSGTSMATPHVAGAAALLLSEHPGWSAAQVKAALLDSGDPIPALATISVTGRRLNAARALGLTVDPDGRAPLSPQGLVAAVEGQAIELDWDEGTEPDLAGYEVWVQEGADPWTLDRSVAASQATVDGLPVERSYSLRVLARDHHDNSSPSSDAVSAYLPAAPAAPEPPEAPPVTPGPPAVTPALPVTPPLQAPVTPPPALTSPLQPTPPAELSRPSSPRPPIAVTPPTPPARSGPIVNPPQPPRVEGLRLQGKPSLRGGASVRFTLAAPARVIVSLSRQVKGRYRPAGTRAVSLGAGPQRLALARVLRLRMPRGSWRLEVRTGGGADTVAFRVR